MLFGFDVDNYTYLPTTYTYFIHGIFINNTFILHSKYLFENFGIKFVVSNNNNFYIISLTLFFTKFYIGIQKIPENIIMDTFL